MVESDRIGLYTLFLVLFLEVLRLLEIQLPIFMLIVGRARQTVDLPICHVEFGWKGPSSDRDMLW